MSSKRWCFTVNNPGDYRPPYNPLDQQYLVWQLERGENGTTHVQGYCRFARKIRLSQVKRILDSERLHGETAKGNEQQNKDYCTKADTRISGPFEFGTFNADAGKAGTRSDLKAATALILSGGSLRQVALEHPEVLVKYPTGLEKLALHALPPPPPTRDLFVHVLWGQTGTGKTHRVRTAFPDLFAVEPGRDPFGKYTNQAVLLFDEFDYSQWPIDKMKKYLDKWPLSLDARYQDRQAYWTTVFIICNPNPNCWYNLPPTSLDFQALHRRIHRITEVISQDQIVELVPPTMAAPVIAPVLAPGAAASSSSSIPLPRPSTPCLISSDSEDDNPRPLKRRNANLGQTN